MGGELCGSKPLDEERLGNAGVVCNCIACLASEVRALGRSEADETASNSDCATPDPRTLPFLDDGDSDAGRGVCTPASALAHGSCVAARRCGEFTARVPSGARGPWSVTSGDGCVGTSARHWGKLGPLPLSVIVAGL